MRHLPRRSVLASSLAAAACATSRVARADDVKAPDVKAPDDKASDVKAAGLHSHARAKGMFYGSALSSTALSNDTDLLDHVLAECGMLVSEDAFKWDALHYDPKKYDFARADALMGWALLHQLPVRGHTLVWHESNPGWLEPALTNKAVAEKILADHIKTVVGRYAGRIAHWDVVNEPIQEDDKKPRALRDSLWLRALGPAYFDIAFHAAEAADPKALRVLNEFGIDYGIDWQIRKRAELLDLCADLVHRKVPIQAVGLQAHLDAGELNIDQNGLAKFVADIASLGLKVIVTELDVRDQRLPASIPARDIAVAAHARAWLDAVLPNKAVLGVLSWGLSDRASWLNDKFPRADGLPQRPLPLDADLNRKKLWAAIAASMDAVQPHARI
jgi:endo-1,4-beta-xylanase